MADATLVSDAEPTAKIDGFPPSTDRDCMLNEHCDTFGHWPLKLKHDRDRAPVPLQVMLPSPVKSMLPVTSVLPTVTFGKSKQSHVPLGPWGPGVAGPGGPASPMSPLSPLGPGSPGGPGSPIKP